jgi:PBP1b-binding outer membrane lipoprotein LpoB
MKPNTTIKIAAMAFLLSGCSRQPEEPVPNDSFSGASLNRLETV